MTEFAIRADHLSKKFRLNPERRMGLKERVVRGKAPPADEFWALKDATFDVPRGSMFGIVGHNGSGKSTALKVVAGIYRPTSGSVVVNGRMSALLELGAGFHPELTGRENIRLNGAILGMTKKQVEAAMDEIIEFAGLGRFIDSPIKTYSSGMFVRLGFAIAVKVDPEVLVIDEVIAVGDEDFQRKCFDYIHELRMRGSTVVIVTHSLGIVSERCDYAMWLDHGEVQAIDTGRAIVDMYLGEVNRAEEERVPEDNKRSLAGREAHDISVQRIELLQAGGEPAPFLTTGKPGTIRIHFESRVTADKVVFGLGLYTQNAINVAGPNSRRIGDVRVAPGTGFIDFAMDYVPFAPDTYLLSTAVLRDGAEVEMLDRVFDVTVRGSAAGEPGLVSLPGRWVPPLITHETAHDDERSVAEGATHSKGTPRNG